MSSSGSRSTRAFTASKTLKRSLNFFIFAAIALVALSIFLSTLFTEDVVIKAELNARESLDIQWRSYQHYYVSGGRVVRPKNDFDTVSEGQAYAMMRAVRQNDRAAFDQIYRWTEENLSRLSGYGDHLLSWRYGTDKLGSPHVLDPNPAIDADLDYALALFIAARRWNDGRAPTGMASYKDKATAVAESIMARAVVLHPNGELVLLPWPVSESAGQEQRLLLNPSYWSPGHYRVFERETGNRRWGKLASDTYRQFARLLGGPRDPLVTVPDWIVMREDGTFTPDPSRGYISGWDAFRAWWRVRLDYDLTGNSRARELIEGRLTPFLDKSMAESGGEVASESARDGTPNVKRPNPGMTAVYSYAMRDFNPVLSRSLTRQSNRRLYQDGEYLYYSDRDDYYTNSWAWLALTEGRLAQPFGGIFDNAFTRAAEEEHQ